MSSATFSLNILYVDDEPTNILTFKHLFKNKYTIYTASSAEEGLEVIQMVPIHIVISDERMPITSGTEFLQQIAEVNPDIIRFILTAYTDNSTIIDAVNTGKANAFFTKPLNVKLLDSKIREYIEVIYLRENNERLLNYLRKKNEMESFISFLSRNLVRTPFEEIDSEINKNLKLLCEFLTADGALIFNSDTGNNSLSLQNKFMRIALSEETETKISVFEKKKGLPYWWKSCLEKSIIFINDKNKSNDLTEHEIQFLDQHKISAVVSVPLWNSDSFLGCLILFNKNARPDWDDDEESFLELVGEIISGIVHKKNSELSLKEYQLGLQQLNKKLTLAEESERRRIAVNLHDHISQSMAMAKIKLSSTIAKMVENENIDDMKMVLEFLNEAISNSRKLTYDLSPPVLYELGIDAAIRWKMEQIETKHGIHVSFITNNTDAVRLQRDTEIFLFRIITELTNNCLKHAEASNLFLNLDYSPDWLRISFKDDGIGFDAELDQFHSAEGNHFGLFSIKERLNYLQGEMKITSKVGSGTEVLVTIPLN
jgi:signal transduction histidine kinase